MLIDAHAHLNFSAFREDADETIKRALAEDIWLINVGSEFNSSVRAVEYAQKYESGVFAAVGLHPIHLVSETTEAQDNKGKIIFHGKAEKYDYEKYKKLAADDRVVAIGEAGLDYYRIGTDDPKRVEEIKNLQKKILSQQIGLAMELNLPVIFHCREAHEDLLEILNRCNYSSSEAEGRIEKFSLRQAQGKLSSNNKTRGVIHSFSGRWSQAEQYLATGFYLGFNGIITFARDYDRVVREMPLDRLILETDCPYLTPIPFRGKRNEPSYVKFVAQKVAELRGITFDEVAKQTTENARKLFGIL